ncbi:hypothetical protein FRUB_06667 [Fimbriiglobus ruber]|uniref:Uncharacterized protein n=2 Tax=Fimbriiglobus ruber TaxID=1908690 RepID=A0A225DMY0_9BACT|nr:hypothetical protein FRUB_06667 [Fimbriiglobus ruber]
MAKVWLADYECEYDGDLPPVCMKCGADAETTARQSFRWHPSWVIVLIFIGVLIWAIVALILTKRMTVYAPLCAAHSRYFFKGRLAILVLVLGAVAYGIGAGVFGVNVMNGPNSPDWAPAVLILLIVGFFVGLVAAAIVSERLIRPAEITNNEIQLVGVSPEFVDAIRDQRRAEREERDRRREKGGGRRRNTRDDDERDY